ncbi:MAG: hypothetical protein R3A52_03275 [Polyangiales bacterium]
MSQPAEPNHGVRYTLELVSAEVDVARYRAEVRAGGAVATVTVRVDRAGASVETDDPTLAPEHRAQLVALAKTLGKRDGAPWPRRVNRWRAPGVR